MPRRMFLGGTGGTSKRSIGPSPWESNFKRRTGFSCLHSVTDKQSQGSTKVLFNKGESDDKTRSRIGDDDRRAGPTD